MHTTAEHIATLESQRTHYAELAARLATGFVREFAAMDAAARAALNESIGDANRAREALEREIAWLQRDNPCTQAVPAGPAWTY